MTYTLRYESAKILGIDSRANRTYALNLRRKNKQNCESHSKNTGFLKTVCWHTVYFQTKKPDSLRIGLADVFVV